MVGGLQPVPPARRFRAADIFLELTASCRENGPVIPMGRSGISLFLNRGQGECRIGRRPSRPQSSYPWLQRKDPELLEADVKDLTSFAIN